MAKQVIQAGLLAKLGNRLQTAFDKHKADETEYGQIELPPGIRGGIAQVTMCKFDVFKTGDLTGQPYFYAQASVIDPADFTDDKGKLHRTYQQLTKIGPEPIADTPDRQGRKTLDDHVAWVLNELRKMGVDTSNLQWNQLEAVASAVTADPKNPIFIRFDTFKMSATPTNPNPRVNHRWLGPASADEAAAAIEAANSAAVQDDTGNLPRPTSNGVHQPPKPTGPVQHAKTPAVGTKPAVATPGAAKPQLPGVKKPAAKPTPAPAPEPEPEPAAEEPGYSDTADIASLAAAADNGDEAARDELIEQARALGIDDDTIASAETWTALGEQMMGNTPAESDDTEAPADEEAVAPEWTPKVEEIYLYKPVDPKTKKPAAKAVDCEVLSVDEENRTVDLKNLNNPKMTYKKVSWDLLDGSEE